MARTSLPMVVEEDYRKMISMYRKANNQLEECRNDVKGMLDSWVEEGETDIGLTGEYIMAYAHITNAMESIDAMIKSYEEVLSDFTIK